MGQVLASRHAKTDPWSPPSTPEICADSHVCTVVHRPTHMLQTHTCFQFYNSDVMTAPLNEMLFFLLLLFYFYSILKICQNEWENYLIQPLISVVPGSQHWICGGS